MENFLKIILLIVISGLTACRDAKVKTAEQNSIVPTDTIETPPTSQQPTVDPKDDKTVYPDENDLQTKILKTGSFHADEVFKNADKIKWFGLFKDSNGFYLEQTSITTTSVHDPVMDGSEKEKTGWQVSTPKKDNNFLLIESLPYLINKRVTHVPLQKNFIYPGDTLRFSYSGTDYMLFATGRKKKVGNESTDFQVWNYKLYMTANINAKPITQLLVVQPDFDDKMIEIIFAGDIDGDGILDLIIDTSRHYNMRNPSLYLSKPAGNKKLVTQVGVHTSVGG